MIRRAVAALLTLAAAPAAVTAQEVAPEWTSPEHVAAPSMNSDASKPAIHNPRKRRDDPHCTDSRSDRLVAAATSAATCSGLVHSGATSWAVTAAGAVGFVLTDGGAGTGVFERLALWPVLGALAAVALGVRRERTDG